MGRYLEAALQAKQLRKKERDPMEEFYTQAALKQQMSNQEAMSRESMAREREMLKHELNLERQRERMNYFGGAQSQGGTDPFSQFNIPENERKDYLLDNRYVSVSGVPIATKIPKLKPSIPTKEAEVLQSGRSQATKLSQNIKDVIGSKNIQSRLNPLDPRAHSNFFGNMLNKVEGIFNSKDVGEFAEFKARTQELFQQYRKFITGAQASFAEIQFLTPVFPETTDPPKVYAAKAARALEDVAQNDRLMSEALNTRGFRPSTIGEFPLDVEGIRGSVDKFQGGEGMSDDIEARKERLRQRYMRGR